MLSVPSGLATDIQNRRTTLALGVKFTRVDTTVLAFTSHDADVTVSSVLYRAASSGIFSAIQTKSDLGIDTIDLAGFGSSYIALTDIRAGKWDKAAFEIIVFNPLAPANGSVIKRAGWLGQSIIQRNSWQFELQSLARILHANVGLTSSPTCRNDLGDSMCQVNLASHTVTGSITSVTNRKTFADSSRSEADAHFTGGKLTWTGGANSGLSFEVKTWTASTKTFVLYQSTPFTVSNGDTYSVHRGCRKRLIEDCKTIFNNVANFDGEYYLPGNDKLQRYGKLGT